MPDLPEHPSAWIWIEGGWRKGRITGRRRLPDGWYGTAHTYDGWYQEVHESRIRAVRRDEVLPGEPPSEPPEGVVVEDQTEWLGGHGDT